jgi:hypothetical protein
MSKSVIFSAHAPIDTPSLDSAINVFFLTFVNFGGNKKIIFQFYLILVMIYNEKKTYKV